MTKVIFSTQALLTGNDPRPSGQPFYDSNVCTEQPHPSAAGQVYLTRDSDGLMATLPSGATVVFFKQRDSPAGDEGFYAAGPCYVAVRFEGAVPQAFPKASATV